jgi:tRNA U34 2-thiouridine synthase MnmA/TrmU
MGKEKVLTLLSGGLDSTLAVKIALDLGFDVEAINFTTPFCLCDKCAVDLVGERYGLKIHRVFVGQEFLDLVANPPHGYGSRMNPCIDCRILMLRKAKAVAQKIGAKYIVTGEVLNERPFSQRKDSMLLIEREAGLEGKILRPLSAKLLPETELEKNGLIDREKLLSIKGRRRRQQINLAKTWNIKDYPCPAGGCLLTDPQFAIRLEDFLKYSDKLTVRDVVLLKIGRHFRIGDCKIVVGRNREENEILSTMVKRENKPYLEVINYMSPIVLLEGDNVENIVEVAAKITVRYSDAPKDTVVDVRYVAADINIVKVRAAKNEETELFRL